MKDLIKIYEKKEVQLLIKLATSGLSGYFGEFVKQRVEEIKKERLRTFFDQLAVGDIQINDETIDSEDFLHCYFSTLRAVVDTRHRDKIKLFANLLLARNENDFKIESHEEFLNILDDLSINELRILNFIRTCNNSSEYKSKKDISFMLNAEQTDYRINGYINRLNHYGLIRKGNENKEPEHFKIAITEYGQDFLSKILIADSFVNNSNITFDKKDTK